MSTQKYIYRRPDFGTTEKKEFVNIHYLVGYSQGSITDHEKARKVMQAEIGVKMKPKDVRCGKVFKSPTVDGFTVTAWDGSIPALTKKRIKELEKSGWRFIKGHRDRDYYY